MKTINIQPKNLTNGVTTAVTGVAVKLNMAIQYEMSENGNPLAKGYYELVSADGTVVTSDNQDVSTTGWAGDDNVMFARFASMLGVVQLT